MQSMLSTDLSETEHSWTMHVFSPTSSPVPDYYRCFDELPAFTADSSLGESDGFFRFGPDVVCYGKAAGYTRPELDDTLFDAAGHVRFESSRIVLPFDLDQVVDNLRYE